MNKIGAEHLARGALGSAPGAKCSTTAAIEAGYRVLFTTAAHLIATLTKALAEGRLDEKLKVYTTPRLLIIDEIGYLPIDRVGANLFFQLISRRYERGPMILTSNQYVYVRQSTADQLLHNHESRRRQYALADRARTLGWSEVVVIDDDLRVSAGGVARPGFERLAAAICSGFVGAVVSIEASRLARWAGLAHFA